MDVCFGGTLDPIIARSRRAKEYEVNETQLIFCLSQKTNFELVIV